jgi:predicted anti-sigma-YlaC factor YlaD
LSLSVGISMTILGVAHSIVMQHPSLAAAPLATAGPWVAAVGIVLVWSKR